MGDGDGSDLDIDPKPLARKLVDGVLIFFSSLAFSQFLWRVAAAALASALLVTQHLLGFLRMTAIQSYRTFVGARLHRRNRRDLGPWLDHILLRGDLNGAGRYDW